MNLREARYEAERYLAYLDDQVAMSRAMQCLASDRRAGRCDDAEKDRRIRELTRRSPAVYDGANLADAIRVFLSETKPSD